MNRWIRGKEIKAEAEWTARWVFRYDKSPRKSLRSFFVSFSRFSPFAFPHSVSVSSSPSHFLSYLFVSFLPFFLHACFFLLSLVFFYFYFYMVLVEEKVARLFDSRIYIPDERIAGTTFTRMNFPSTVIEMPFSTCKLARLARHSEIFTSTADRVLLACRFKTAVEIVDFSPLKQTARCFRHFTQIYDLSIRCICNASCFKKYFSFNCLVYSNVLLHTFRI